MLRKILLGFGILIGLPALYIGGILWDISVRDGIVEASGRGDVGEIKRWRLLGASPSRVGWESHDTPLTAAVRQGNSKALAYLLEIGADPTVENDFHETPLKMATGRNNPVMIALLQAHLARRK